MSTVTPPQRPAAARPGGSPPRSGPAPSSAAAIDPIRVIRRHLFGLIVSVFVGVMLGAAAFLLLLRYYPIYSSEVVFEIRAGLQQSTDLGVQEIRSDDLVMRLANTESVILTGRDVLGLAVRHPDIRVTEWHKNHLVIDENGNETLDMQSAISDLEESLRAGPIRGTNFFRLRWSAHHASDLPVVMNRVSEIYLARRAEADEAVWNRNVDVFMGALSRTQDELEALDREIQLFIREAGITTLIDSRHSQVAISADEMTRQIGMVSSTMTLAQSSLLQTRAKLIGTIEPSPDDLQEARLDRTVQLHEQRLASLKSEQRTWRERYSEGHPALAQIAASVRSVEYELEASLQEVVRRNLEARYKRLQDELERTSDLLIDLESEIESKDAELRELTASTAHYHSLELRRKRLEAQRELELSLIKEIDLIRARADASRVRRVQEAIRPQSRSFPRWHIIIPLTTLLTLGFTLLVVFFRELTDQRIKSASDLSVIHGAKVLGVIPELEEDPTRSKKAELVVSNHPQSVLAESYRQACALLTRSIERNGHQTILLLSGLPGAGTTTSVTNIGVSLAATGRRVLVIDANFRRPNLSKVMGVREDGPGLGDLLIGQASIDDALQESEAGISVISAGTPSNRVFERLNNGLFESIVAELRGRFDVILFDAPPAVVAGDAMVLANRVDAAILVIRANQEQRGLVARIVGQLSDTRCDALGILLNRPRGTAGGYFKKNFKTMARYTAES